MFQFFRRSAKKKPLKKHSTKWKLYLLLALLIFLIASCGGNGGVKKTDNETVEQPTQEAVSSGTSEPVRTLPVTNAQTHVLILHDSAGEWGYIGKEHAMLLENLLGHFNVSIRSQPVSLYQAGQLNKFTATFYLGTTYDEPSFYPEDSTERANYAQFLVDAKTTSRTVVWINHNLWKLAWEPDTTEPDPAFLKQFGFNYRGLFNQTFNRVEYNGVEFKKGVVRFANPGAVLDGCEQEADGQYACSPELNRIAIENPQKAEAHAIAYSTVDTEGEATPYITQSGNFWFVGDLPFLHHSIEDRYLVFSDLLFDMLDTEAESALRPAVLRLDKIHPRSDTQQLEAVLEFLADENVPVAAAVSPLYVDNRKTEDTLTLNASPVGTILREYQSTERLSILAHGLSHQWEGGDNPNSGITGEDYEFYSVRKNDDLSLNLDGKITVSEGEDNRAMARLNRAASIFKETGLYSFAWIAPEYMAGETDYLAAQSQYPVHYGRLHYFSPQGPAGRFVGQMFPYSIDRDRYNYCLIPENLGGIDPEPPTGYEVVSVPQILENAEKLATVRDSIASVYFDITQPLDQLEQLVDGLKAQGLTFIAPCTLGYSCRDTLPDTQWLTFKSRVYNNYLSAGDASNNSEDIVVNGLSGSVDQAWSIIEQDNNYMQVQSLKTGRCLVAEPDSLLVAQALCDAENEKQLWKQFGSDIRNRAIGLCLDVAADRQVVITSVCDNSDSQQWQLSWERSGT